MKEFYKFLSVILCSSFIMAHPLSGNAQVQTPRYITTCANSHAFYEYLPAGYSTGSQTYPVMLFIHGLGELGPGNAGTLPTVLRNGPPRLINDGNFPQSVTVGGKTFSFIVISPQFVGWPTSWDLDTVMTYVSRHYRIDVNRIYVTGLSMGGGAVWDYISNNSNSSRMPKSTAAAAIAAGATDITWGDEPKVIAAANVPVFAVHNQRDPTVPVSNTINNVNAINASNPGPNPKAVDTIFNEDGHDSWSKMYDPNLAMHNGLNIYQWMLQYVRNVAGGPLPVTYTAYGATASADGQQVVVNWTTAIEENNNYFILQRSADGQQFSDLDTIAAFNQPHSYTYIDENPLPGVNFYRLEQTDLDGRSTFAGTRKVTASTTGTKAFRLSPNPASGPVTMQLTHPEGGKIEVWLTDVSGKTLKKWNFQKSPGAWDQSIDVSGFPAGSYFIKVRGTSIREVKTLIKK